jgi:hypothetical protein
VQNHPFVLKSVLQDVFAELPAAAREKITFHTFLYNEKDLEKYKSSGFGEGLPFVVERKRGYESFVKFVAGCDGVINLTAGSILGRITFLAAALGRAGIFSANSGMNARLYPGATVEMFDTVRLRELAGAMLRGEADGRLLPSEQAAREVGDFEANRARLRQIAGA